MKTYKLMLIDLDGTMYRGNEKIEEAPIFINQLREAGQEFMFLTNNSTKRPQDVAHHLATFGVQAHEELIYTPSLATAEFISGKKEGALVYAIGEAGLQDALRQAGCKLVSNEKEVHHCDFVVMGLDRDITYQKLAKATLAVRSGATFISTNSDKALPTERGLLPGNGALTSVVATSTGVQPIYIGKPEPLMIELILEQKGLKKKDLLMVGDNYETDILAGIQSGIDTAIVFTGFTSREDLMKMEIQPTYKWDTLLDYAKN